MISRLTDANDIELEASLEELLLDLRCDAVKTDVALRKDGCTGLLCVNSSHGDELDSNEMERVMVENIKQMSRRM